MNDSGPSFWYTHPDLGHIPNHAQPQFPHLHNKMGESEQWVPSSGIPQVSKIQALAADIHCRLSICQHPTPQTFLFPGTHSVIWSISPLLIFQHIWRASLGHPPFETEALGVPRVGFGVPRWELQGGGLKGHASWGSRGKLPLMGEATSWPENPKKGQVEGIEVFHGPYLFPLPA